jgi:hypothetical protein
MNRNDVKTATDVEKVGSTADVARVRTLGTVRLRHHATNEIILIPTPSNDPNDPLNW